MKRIKKLKEITLLLVMFLITFACDDNLYEPYETVNTTEDIDYTDYENMKPILIGAYERFQTRGWEEFPLISVRGDDVNPGGLGDQQPFADTDYFNYDKDYWMYNSLWQNYYRDIFDLHTAMEILENYKEAGANPATANQYIAEVKTIRAFMLFQLARVWGDVFITTSSDPTELLVASISSKEEVLQHISDQMDEAISNLPDMNPNQRNDLPGGITKYTALAIKALANLELKNYQNVADATGSIISSGNYSLEPDFYELFKTGGKLNDENILELQYSDFNQGEGDSRNYLNAFFGPQGWTPAVEGAASGWGFYEPSIKYIKFMLDRGETVRLETSVLFTDRGIAEIKTDPNYAELPEWISNTTRDGDIINDYARAKFASGKHYLPSNQLIPGRTSYGSNKNFKVIRYAEILLMYAEALTQGASGSGMTADQAVNAVRERAGLGTLSGVTTQQVMDEKFAEMAMEWGVRYYDLIRLGQTSELNYGGRTFSEDKTYLPYPQAQIDQIPALRELTQ
jgi:hypothetical protein